MTMDAQNYTEVTENELDAITVILDQGPTRCTIEVRAIGHTIDELEANAMEEASAFARAGRFIDPEIIRDYAIKPLSPLFIDGGGYYAYLKITFTATPPVVETTEETVQSPRHGTSTTSDETTESRSVGRRRRAQIGQVHDAGEPASE